MKSSRWLPLGLFLLLAAFAGTIGAIATATSVHTWYPTLQKPAWTPPNWLFGPAWTLLYILMSIAAWRVWRVGGEADARHTSRLFAAQLALNALWSVLFFGLHRPGLALVEVIVLWLVLIRIYVRFRAADRIAGWLWLPYLLWVSYATLLNAAVWELNR
ncbi:TspO/MBR family protein [Opitutus terrae]|uniref:TspO and MBR like protein n=1 Tax=Opitutus terrae (strain DSM 11246 / JCM 15787 / PB90-1) TaxID=452637 RepID=B1ZUT7_OPITP|nr:TspO/MBR family protein [Opitutus terrae]ACB74971.1 TspO and MBR like protein [Opitutus terrae PB90-1]